MVDDGSTDGTATTLAAAAATDRRLRLIRLTHRSGVAAALQVRLFLHWFMRLNLRSDVGRVR